MGIREWFSSKTTSDFSPLSDAHKKRRELFNLCWSYYRGHHKRYMKVSPTGVDDNVILNYSAAIVNQGIDFLFGKEVVFEIDSDSLERNPQEQYLDMVWGDAETKMTFLQKLAQNGGVCGTAFLRLYPPEPGISDSLPRLVNLEPGSVDVITAEDDAEQVVAYHIVWKAGETWKRERIDYIVEGDYWTITPERAENNRRWVENGPVEPWTWPFPPVFSCQNLPLANSIWGISDLENADLNDVINRTASNTNRIIRYHAHPKTVGFGFNAKNLETVSVNEFWTVENTDAKIQNIEMQSDLVSSREFMRDMKTGMYKINDASELDPAQVNVGALSGFALKILYGPTLARTNKKRNTYGALLKQVNKALLLMVGQEVDDVTNVWNSPLPESDLEAAQTLAIDVQNGLSKATYLERRGYNPLVEMEKRKRESQEAIEQQQAFMGARSPFQRAMNELGSDEDEE